MTRTDSGGPACDRWTGGTIEGIGWTATNRLPPRPGSGRSPARRSPRQVLWLGAPVLVEQLLLYLVGLSDTLLAGRYLEAEHLAAVTVSTYLLWFLASILTIVSVGATALVARFIGANQPAAAARIAQQAVTMALVRRHRRAGGRLGRRPADRAWC